MAPSAKLVVQKVSEVCTQVASGVPEMLAVRWFKVGTAIEDDGWGGVMGHGCVDWCACVMFEEDDDEDEDYNDTNPTVELAKLA